MFREIPVHANLLAGNKVFLAGQHDGVVAIGGGSGLDIAKLIAVMARADHPRWDSATPRLVDTGGRQCHRAGARGADDGRHGLRGGALRSHHQ